jgi:hypothetical protein
MTDTKSLCQRVEERKAFRDLTDTSVRLGNHVFERSNIGSKQAFEEIMKNWTGLVESLDEDKTKALSAHKAFSVLESYVTSDKTKLTDKTMAVSTFAHKVLKKTKNLKSLKESVSASSIDDEYKKTLIEICDRYRTYDRIIDNHKELNNRSGFDELIYEYGLSDDNINDCVYELCSVIDRFEMSLPKKVNVCLENICYGLGKSGLGIKLSTENIIDLIYEYFAIAHGTEGLETVIRLSESGDLFGYSPMSGSKILYSGYGQVIREAEETLKEKIIKDVKARKDIDASKIKEFVIKIYTKSDANIIEETPNVLSWVRIAAILGTAAIHPFITIPMLIVDQLIRFKYARDETKRIISKYKSEKTKVEKRIKKIKNEKAKERLQSYLKELNKCIDKLTEYEDSLYTSKENEEREEKRAAEDIGDDDWGDFNFDESASMSYRKPRIQDDSVREVREWILWIKKTDKALTESKNTTKKINIVRDERALKKITESDCETVTIFTDENGKLRVPIGYVHIEEPVKENVTALDHVLKGAESALSFFGKTTAIFDYNAYGNIYKIYAESTFELGYSYNDTGVDYDLLCDAAYIEAVRDCFDKLKKTGGLTSISESIEDQSVKEMMKEVEGPKAGRDIYDTLDHLIGYCEACEILNEISFGTKLQQAKDKLQKFVQTASDKEKIISRQIDGGLDKYYGALERDLTNKNREAVIKGKVLPSFSALIKIALVGGLTAALFHPIAGVIVVLGTIGVSKLGTLKEKQYILDEIDVQLKLIEKKISIAEGEGDMHKVEELMRLETQLKRERNRIFYYMKSSFPLIAGNPQKD